MFVELCPNCGRRRLTDGSNCSYCGATYDGPNDILSHRVAKPPSRESADANRGGHPLGAAFAFVWIVALPMLWRYFFPDSRNSFSIAQVLFATLLAPFWFAIGKAIENAVFGQEATESISDEFPYLARVADETAEAGLLENGSDSATSIQESNRGQSSPPTGDTGASN